MTSELAPSDLLWATLSLVLPVMFGHITARRSPALAFSASIHFTMKRHAFFPPSPAIPPRAGLQLSTTPGRYLFDRPIRYRTIEPVNEEVLLYYLPRINTRDVKGHIQLR